RAQARVLVPAPRGQARSVPLPASEPQASASAPPLVQRVQPPCGRLQPPRPLLLPWQQQPSRLRRPSRPRLFRLRLFRRPPSPQPRGLASPRRARLQPWALLAWALLLSAAPPWGVQGLPQWPERLRPRPLDRAVAS